MAALTTGTEASVTDTDLLLTHLGPRRQDVRLVVPLIAVYGLMFLTGILGNACTCVVISRNRCMQTTTNYYLFSLAVSDILLLLFGLPCEAYAIWESYPWRFGEPFCIFKALLMEMTSYTSVLTITAFTTERYLAICHPLRAHTMSGLSRAAKIIVSIWLLSLVCALPYAIYTRTAYFVYHPVTGEPVKESLQCNIPLKWMHGMTYMFHISTFLFFFAPFMVISILYLLIGIAVRKSTISRSSSGKRYPRHPSGSTSSSSSSAFSQSRRTVLKISIAVVVIFFVCWAPFHTQRLLVMYIKKWTPAMMRFQSHWFYVSGVLYYVNSTVNPILYNVISGKYREAFRTTLWRCGSADGSAPQTPNRRAATDLKPSRSSRKAHGADASSRNNSTTSVTTIGLAKEFTVKDHLLQSMRSGGRYGGRVAGRYDDFLDEVRAGVELTPVDSAVPEAAGSPPEGSGVLPEDGEASTAV